MITKKTSSMHKLYFRKKATIENRSKISGSKIISQTGKKNTRTHYLVRPIHSSLCSESKIVFLYILLYIYVIRIWGNRSLYKCMIFEINFYFAITTGTDFFSSIIGFLIIRKPQNFVIICSANEYSKIRLGVHIWNRLVSSYFWRLK